MRKERDKEDQRKGKEKKEVFQNISNQTLAMVRGQESAALAMLAQCPAKRTPQQGKAKGKNWLQKGSSKDEKQKIQEGQTEVFDDPTPFFSIELCCVFVQH